MYLKRFAKTSGLEYLARFMLKYPRKHSLSNFAGRIAELQSLTAETSLADRDRINRDFLSIVDCLVLANGVTKTTYPHRHDAILSELLNRDVLSFNTPYVRVLDIPSSVGVSGLASRELLTNHYTITAYTLADICFHVLYDESRGCIFDDAGNLLQLRGRWGFWSVYRPHMHGDGHGPLARIPLSVFDLYSALLRRRFPFNRSATRALSLIHPNVQGYVESGEIQLAHIDVFQPIPCEYDLILSFNLLQRNYFSDEELALGRKNLLTALSDGGFLILGNTTDYVVIQKVGGDALTVHQSDTIF